MSEFETGYQALGSYYDDHDDQEGPPTHIIHAVPSNNKVRWNHIENLDEFFTRVYQYHQRSGFLCMLVQDLMQILQFVFVVLFSVFLMKCVDYDTLFYENQHNGTHKVSIPEAVDPLDQCVDRLDGFVGLCLFMGSLFVLFRLVKFVYNLIQYYEIRAFYLYALKISAEELNNMTWHEVQRRLLDVQKEQQMCIHKLELTQLDIYHRILRFKNYMVAMVNKSLLPLQSRILFIGEYIFLSTALKYNLEMILFWGPWSPFENNWHLKPEYKNHHKRKELANKLSRQILWVGIANLLFAPIIFMWQILYSFFRYAEMIKREPSFLGSRMWSLYSRLYARHFNELDHEFYARLNRAYKPAERYMNIFTSPLLVVLAKHGAFFAGSILAVFIILTVVDEDFLAVEHVIATMTVLGVIVTICRSVIPDEHLVNCPELLMRSVLAQLHYMPDTWKGNAHTYRVRDEFAMLFQYKAIYLVEELLSPLTTPFLLVFKIRSKSLEIVDFFRNFTVEVTGVGDVCSFAQMDVRRHGNPTWVKEGTTEANQYQQAEDGKTELSLMHFTVTNPEWKPPEVSNIFINNLREHVHHDATMTSHLPVDNPLINSLNSSGLGFGYQQYTSILSSMAQQSMMPHGFAGSQQVTSPTGERPHTAGSSDVEKGEGREAASASVIGSQSQQKHPQPHPVRGGLKNAEGPVGRDVAEGGGGGLLASIQQSYVANSTYGTQLPPLQNPEWIARSAVSAMGAIPQYSTMIDPHRRQYDTEALEMLSNEMSFSALYMHELHRRRMLNPAFDNLNYEDIHARAIWQSPPTRNEDNSPVSPSAANDTLKDISTSRERSSIPTRGRALSAVTEASFKTADEEEGSETELQELVRSNKEDQPLLPDIHDSFNPAS